ncbi:MAG: chloride channel protein [Candidatus Dormibacteraeota bacterium]|nr:chloride channel protein [Candidatus Dormibacteraeota bacterium]
MNVTAATIGQKLRMMSPRTVRDWVRGSSGGLVPMALFIGAGAGAGAIAFRYLILWFTRVFSGHDDYSAAGHAVHPGLPWLGIGFVVLAPVVGGLIYGPLIQILAPEARGHGVPEVMLAVAEKGGRIRPRVALVKSLASALTIGSGGSVGREGPIVQIGSALGSALGQWLHVPESRLRILVACGAAGGISATFNAPIAGVFFALELILQDFAADSFGVVVLASITAAAIGRAAFGSSPFLTLPAFHLTSPGEYAFYAGLGILAAGVGVGFIRVLYGSEDLVDRLWRGPEWLRPAVGGLALGLLLLVLPQMYGVGYPVLEKGIRGDYIIGFLLLLMVGKMVATSLTIAIGGSGGVFAPSLFIGAMLGTGYGEILQRILPGSTANPGAYGIVGMGAVFAAAARAPITAVIIIFELTGDYAIILPLMFAVVLSSGLSTLLSRDTIYTLKLRRRGIEINRGRQANLMQLIRVRDAMQAAPPSVGSDTPLDALIERMIESGTEALPVIDPGVGFRGVVKLSEVESAMRDNALDMSAGDLVIDSPSVRPDQTLESALAHLTAADGSGLPVLDQEGASPAGWLTHRDVLQAYSRRLGEAVEEAHTRSTQAPGVPAGLRDYRIVDLTLNIDRPPVGRLVREVAWPPGSLVLALSRGDGSEVVAGSTRLLRGDRLTVLTPASFADDLDERISADGLPETAS